MAKPTYPTRPVCPDCGREMVYLCTNSGPELLCCYLCDCKNGFLAEEIRACRDDPSPDASIAMTTEVYQEEEELPQVAPGQQHRLLQFYCPN